MNYVPCILFQCNFGRVIPDEEMKDTLKEVKSEVENKIVAKNGKPISTDGEPTGMDVETVTTKTGALMTNTTEPVGNDKPKLPLWKAALKQKKEAEVKQKDDKHKKLVSNVTWQLYANFTHQQNCKFQISQISKNFCQHLATAVASNFVQMVCEF